MKVTTTVDLRHPGQREHALLLNMDDLKEYVGAADGSNLLVHDTEQGWFPPDESRWSVRLHLLEFIDTEPDPEPDDEAPIDPLADVNWADRMPTYRLGTGQRYPKGYTAAWAAAYVQQMRAGYSLQPGQRLAEVTGFTPGQVSQIISRARRDGLLTGTKQGTPGGELTPACLDLLTNYAEVRGW